MPQEDHAGEIVARGPTAPLLSNDELDRTWRVATALAKSGMFKDARQAEQALAKILLGRDLGLSPTQAMTGIHIVEGRPQVAAVTLASFVKQAPGYDYKVLRLDDEQCAIEFSFEDVSLGVSEFSMVDAKRANLIRSGSAWEKTPRNMLFARAISNGVKWFCPDVTHGVPVYYEGEYREGVALTAPGEHVEADFGDDETVAAELRDTFDALGYTPAKVRTVLRGCTTHEERVDLLAELRSLVPADADVVEEPVA